MELFKDILLLIIGITTSLMFLTIFYTLLVIKSSKKDIKKLNIKKVKLDKEIKKLIKKKKKKYGKSKIKQAKGKIMLVKFLSSELAFEISSIYFPESDNPKFEITIDESLELLKYIGQRLDLFLNRPGFKIIKKTKISTLIRFMDTKSKLDKITFAKTRVYRFLMFLNKLRKLLNPIYLVKSVGIGISMNMLYKEFLQIVGEECDRIYSKSLFNKDIITEEEFNEINI